MLAATAAVWLAATPIAQAQSTMEARVDQIDKRLRTVERVVSRQTGGSGLVEPEITPTQATPLAAGTPASGPITDLQQRMTAVEGQLSSLTGQVETTGHRLRMLEDQFAAYQKTTDARLKALEGNGDAAPAPAGAGGPTAPPPSTRPAPATGGADPARAQKVAAVNKPRTSDAGDDAYTYGYRLWQAKLYPEAETQLAGFAGKYPGHARVSRARNLLGMIYLDDAKPNLAAQIFYENYSKDPEGERARDSLLNLAKTLVVLKKPSTEVCRVYAEATKTYGTSFSPAQKAIVDKGRADNKCK